MNGNTWVSWFENRSSVSTELQFCLCLMMEMEEKVGSLSHAGFTFNKDNSWTLTVFVWCEDICHASDVSSQYSPCRFCSNYFKSSLNLFQLKAEIFTPRNWNKHHTSFFAKLPHPLMIIINLNRAHLETENASENWHSDCYHFSSHQSSFGFEFCCRRQHIEVCKRS